MAGELYQKIKKDKLYRRLGIFRVLVYVAAVIAAGSFALCIIDWQGVSWLLIGATYTMLAINFVMQQRLIRKELDRRVALRSNGRG